MTWIKKALISLTNDDESDYPTIQIQYNGIVTDAFRMTPYGVASNPPKDTLAIVMSPDGREDDPIAMAVAGPNRFKPLGEGEIAFGNEETGSNVRFLNDGSVEWRVEGNGDLVISTSTGALQMDIAGDASVNVSGSVDVTANAAQVTAPNVTINGNLVVNGTVTATIDVIGGPTNTSLIGHIHPDPVSGNTGPPV